MIIINIITVIFFIPLFAYLIKKNNDENNKIKENLNFIHNMEKDIDDIKNFNQEIKIATNTINKEIYKLINTSNELNQEIKKLNIRTQEIINKNL